MLPGREFGEGGRRSSARCLLPSLPNSQPGNKPWLLVSRTHLASRVVLQPAGLSPLPGRERVVLRLLEAAVEWRPNVFIS